VNFLIEIKEGLGIAIGAIWANKMRSALTTLGIIIGIVTVTLMGAAINGLNTSFHKSISSIGADVLYLNRIGWFVDSREEWLKQQKHPIFTRDQVRAVERLRFASHVAPVVQTSSSISYSGRDATGVSVIGTTDEYLPVTALEIAEGRFFTPLESDAGRRVCILGTNVASRFFTHSSPLGQTIRLGRDQLEVIGVIAKQGSFGDIPSADDQVIIPLAFLRNRFTRDPDVSIQIKVDSIDHLPDAEEELRQLMRRLRHLAPKDPDDFSINQQEQILAIFNRVAGTIAAVALAITGLSLFVGGIGIMNIMFVSVAERTREIGVRKAIGAKPRAILFQFLVEAALICLFGGLIGLGLTYGLTFAVSYILPVKLSLPVVALALLVSLITGVASGFFPAWRAARMNAVDALRNE